MSDGQIFISYSRRDKEFVRRLVDALKDAGREVWVDWDDIPPSADWMQEIYAGIEDSIAFVSIISPDAITSPIIREELEHALEMNKRLVPVLYRDVSNEERETMHPMLSSHNWIFMADENQFDESLTTVLSAIDTDLEHVNKHTRLLVRAREWETKGRSGSLLLRGDDLREARDWFEQAAKKDPSPTDLHSEYITASRRVQRNRRVISMAVAIYAVTIAGLLAFALAQYLRAEDQRDIAVENAAEAVRQAAIAQENEDQARRNAREAQSLSLSGNSLVALSNSNTDLAVAMAVAAVQIGAERPEVEFALAEAAYSPGTRARLEEGHTDAVTTVVYHNDGSVAYTGSSDGTVAIWDVGNNVLIDTFRPHQGEITALRVEAGKQLLLSAGRDGYVVITDLANYEPINRWQAHGYAVHNAEFIPNTDTIMTIGCDELGQMVNEIIPLCATPGIYIYDYMSGDQLQVFETETSEATALAISPDGLHAAVAYSNSPFATGVVGISMWSLEDQSLEHNLRGHTDVIEAMDFSPDSARLVSASQDGTLIQWNVNSGELLQTFEGHSDWVFGVDYSRNGRRIISSAADNTLILWRNDGVMERRFFGHEDWILDVAFSPDSDTALSVPGNLFLESRDTAPRVWDITNGAQFRSLAPPSAAFGPVRSVDVSPLGTIAATGSVNGSITLWDVTTGQEFLTWQAHDDVLEDIDFSDDGSRIATASIDGSVSVWDTSTQAELLRVGAPEDEENPFEPFQAVAISPDGTQVVGAGQDTSIYQWDIESGDLVTTFTGFDGDVRGLDFNSDGTRLLSVTGGFSGTLDIWQVTPDDLIDEPIIRMTGGHTDTMLDAIFSPADAFVLSAGFDSTILLWSVESESVVRAFNGHTGPVNHIAFTADGEEFLSGSTDTTVRLWDVESGLEIRRFDGHEDRVNQVAFMGNGLAAFSASEDGTVRMWQIHSVDTLLEWTQNNRFVRKLTCNERMIYNVPPMCDINQSFAGG